MLSMSDSPSLPNVAPTAPVLVVLPTPTDGTALHPLRAAVAELGAQCVDVHTPEEALAAVARERPVAVLLDLRHDELGSRLLRALRDIDSRGTRALATQLQDVPVLALIATPEGDVIRRAYQAGASDVLSLTLGPDVLAAKMRAWLRLAERAGKMLSLRDFAHEARHPITAIGAAAHMLMSEVSLAASSDLERRRLSQTILAESERIGRMVEHYLDSDQTLRIGDAPLTEEPLQLIRNLLSINLTADQRQRVTLRAEGEISELSVDPDHLRQMLLNLLENALTATASSGDVSIEVFVEAGGAAIAVRDTGTGIRPDDLARIFEDGFSTRSTHSIPLFPSGSSPNIGSPRRRGLGLGITQRLCLAAGGRICVSSEAGRGTTFVLWLPRAPHYG